MRRVCTRTLCRMAVVGLAGSMMVALTPATGLAQAEEEGARPFLVIDHAGLGSLIADPRDQGLAEALAMLPARIGELPAEIDDMPPEAAGYLQLALQTIARPARVAITYEGDNPSGGFFGYGFIASIDCKDKADADAIQDAILELTKQIAENSGGELKFTDSDRFENMQQIMLPFGLVSFGPRRDGDTWRYELIVGTINDPDEAFTDLPQIIDARDYQPFVRGQLDLSTLTPAARLVTNFAGADAPEAAEYIERFEQMGLVGEDAIKVDFESGRTPEMTMSRAVVRGAAKYATALSLPQGHVTRAELKAIPRDTYSVIIGKADFDSIQRTLDNLDEQGLPVYEALDDFEDATHVNLIEDVFANLGGTFAMYNAESTGGGSLLSTVVMVTVKDRARFTKAIGRLAKAANRAIDEDEDGPGKYIELVPWHMDDTQLLSLHFPGLPVPLEMTFAMSEDWFIAALTPQAAMAAAIQADGMGDAGLTANRRFAPFYEKYGQDATSLSFVDSAKTLRAGYPFLNLISSAIANGVRSPGEADDREPGMILPLYNTLKSDHVVPMVRITRWDGDDLVTTMWNDSSLWVQAGSGLGAASAAIPLIAAGVGAAAIADENNWDFGMIDSGLPIIEQADAAASLLRRAIVVDPLSQAAASALLLHNPGVLGGNSMLLPAAHLGN